MLSDERLEEIRNEYPRDDNCWEGRAFNELLAEIDRLREREKQLSGALSRINDEICQTLGKALGYPWFKDDQKNFPGATESSGVCVGEHVAESIAMEAASAIDRLRAASVPPAGAVKVRVAVAMSEDGAQWMAAGESGLDGFTTAQILTRKVQSSMFSSRMSRVKVVDLYVMPPKPAEVTGEVDGV